MKLLSHHQNTDTAEEKEKAAAKTVLRSVILLTPIFGITWIFGLAVMIIDLTSGVLANVINYTFVVLNSFQVGTVSFIQCNRKLQQFLSS